MCAAASTITISYAAPSTNHLYNLSSVARNQHSHIRIWAPYDTARRGFINQQLKAGCGVWNYTASTRARRTFGTCITYTTPVQQPFGRLSVQQVQPMTRPDINQRHITPRLPTHVTMQQYPRRRIRQRVRPLVDASNPCNCVRFFGAARSTSA